MTILDTALAAARAEISVIPLLADGSKKPAGRWKRAMTERSDELALRAVLAAAEGYGVVCGEISGRLLALDFEGRFMDRGGLTELIERFDKAGLGDLYATITSGYTVWTPSGGMHILIRLMDGCPMPGNEKLANNAEGRPLIETRGEGGFVVGADSNGHTHANGGCWTLEEGGYDTIAYVTPGEWEAIRFVLASFDERPVAAPPLAPLTLGVSDHTPTGGSMIERSKPYWPSMASVLEAHGWTFVRSERSGDLWRHPQATNEHSARINRNGRLYAWSGLPQTSDASGNRTWDVPEVDLMLRLGREPSSAEIGHWCAQLLPSGPTADQPGGVHTSSPPVSAQDTSSVIDEAFWGSPLIPWAAELYEAAIMRGRSPDAVLGAFLVLYATTIPVGLQLSTQQGYSPLNLFHTIVGRSGAGKSQAIAVAAELLGDYDPNLAWQVGLRSGEGLISAATIPKSDPTDYRPAVQLEFDEGALLGTQADRQGNTVIDYLNAAWAGSAVGGALAAGMARVPGGRVRWTMVMGLQPGAAPHLFTGAPAIKGFPQRLDFFAAKHPAVPESRPRPGRVRPLTLTSHLTGGTIEAAGSVEDEVWAWQHSVTQERQVHDPLDGHMMLKRLRLSAVLALSVGQKHVSEAFWALGGLLENSSISQRTILTQAITDDARAKARAAGELDAVRQEASASAAETRIRAGILRVLAANPSGLTASGVVRSLTSVDREPAKIILLAMMNEGAVTHRDGRLFLRGA